jgi:hypothetical protein
MPHPAGSGIGGVKGHNTNDATLPGSLALCLPTLPAVGRVGEFHYFYPI